MILTVLFLALLLAKIFGVIHLSWWIVAPILAAIVGLKLAKWITIFAIFIISAFAEASQK